MSEIKIKSSDLIDAKRKLDALAERSIKVTNPFEKSLGKATQAEKEIISILEDICKNVLPALCTNTGKLLEVIANEFQEADNAVADEYNSADAGSTGSAAAASAASTTNRSSQTPHEYQIKGRS